MTDQMTTRLLRQFTPRAVTNLDNKCCRVFAYGRPPLSPPLLRWTEITNHPSVLQQTLYQAAVLNATSNSTAVQSQIGETLQPPSHLFTTQPNQRHSTTSPAQTHQKFLQVHPVTTVNGYKIFPLLSYYSLSRLHLLPWRSSKPLSHSADLI